MERILRGSSPTCQQFWMENVQSEKFKQAIILLANLIWQMNHLE
jgi:hypothetical protein